MAGEELKVPVSIPVETNASDAAESVESLRTRIAGASDEIKAMQGTMKQLRGESGEVKKAKEELTAKVEALKNSVSSASLALVKQGTSYDAAAQKEKKYAEAKKKLAAEIKKGAEDKAKDRTDAMSSAIGKAGGPVASLKGKLDSLKSVMGSTSGASGLLTLAAAGVIAAIAAVAAAAIAGAYALGKFILTSVNTARSAGLLREAWSGSAANAARLGSQIDALAKKVPTSKEALNDLGIKLMAMRIPGQATVDTMNAVAQASAALGDQGGAKLQSFIDRAKMFSQTGKGFRLAQEDFADGALGNLEFTDVAGALAKNLGIGMKEAKDRLRSGTVSVTQGAKALRDASERAFGDLNIRKMGDLDTVSKKFHETLENLTSGVSMESLVKPMADLLSLFDEGTVTGSALKMLVTEFGQGVVNNLTMAMPFIKAFVQGLVIGGLEVYKAFLVVKDSLKAVFGDQKMVSGADALKAALWAGKWAAIGIASAIVLVGGVMALGMAPILAMIAGFAALNGWMEDLHEKWHANWNSFDMAGVGKNIIDGLVAGLKSGAALVVSTVNEIGDSIKGAFTSKLKIHSPSQVFAEYGKNTTEGYEQGVERGSAGAQGAVASMVSTPSGGGRAGGGGGAGIVLNVAINVNGGSGGEATAKSLSDPSFLAKLTKAVEDALVGAGIPVLT